MSRRAAACVALLLAAQRATAAGGAHVVDDAAIQAPGGCYVEAWATSGSGDSGVATAVPGCTLAALPRLELAVSASRVWSGSSRQTVAGPSPKLLLRREDTGFGVALSAGGGWDTGSGRLETAAANLPLTWPLSGGARLHVNAGWQWARGAGDNAFSGIQAEVPLASGLGLMVETFRRDPGKAGAQAGLRWTTGGGAIDIDVLVGRYVDGATRSAVTFGITLRH